MEMKLLVWETYQNSDDLTIQMPLVFLCMKICLFSVNLFDNKLIKLQAIFLILIAI